MNEKLVDRVTEELLMRLCENSSTNNEIARARPGH